MSQAARRPKGAAPKSYGRTAAGGATPAIVLEASAGFEGPDHDSPPRLEGAQ